MSAVMELLGVLAGALMFAGAMVAGEREQRKRYQRHPWWEKRTQAKGDQP